MYKLFLLDMNTCQSEVEIFKGECLLTSLRGVVANVLDYEIVVGEFELHLRDYVYFQTNTLEKSMNPLSPTNALSVK